MTAPNPASVHPYARPGNQPRACRHCERSIVAQQSWWVDSNGFTYCAKRLPHEPMPQVP